MTTTGNFNIIDLKKEKREIDRERERDIEAEWERGGERERFAELKNPYKFWEHKKKFCTFML